MIAYKTRQQDLEEQSMILDVLSSAIFLYQRTEDKDLEPLITFWEEELNRIQTELKGDYTVKEEKYNRIIRHLTNNY